MGFLESVTTRIVEPIVKALDQGVKKLATSSTARVATFTRFGTTAIASHEAIKKFEVLYGPKEGVDFKVGEQYTINGEKMYFYGYIGHGLKTLTKDWNPNRGIWATADKQKAQDFAEANADSSDPENRIPTIACIFSEEPINYTDHGLQKYPDGSNAPLLSDVWIGKRCIFGVLEEVKPTNRLGLLAAYKRMKAERNAVRNQ